MLAGVLHEPPLSVTPCPLASTAAQNEDDEHDTEVSPPLPSIKAGVLHEPPL